MTSFTIGPPVCLSIPVCPLHLPHVPLHSLFFLLSLSLSSAQGQRGVWNGRNTQGTLCPVFPACPEKDTEKADVPTDWSQSCSERVSLFLTVDLGAS